MGKVSEYSLATCDMLAQLPLEYLIPRRRRMRPVRSLTALRSGSLFLSSLWLKALLQSLNHLAEPVKVEASQARIS